MSNKLRDHLSPSLVLAMVALFAAVGGGAYAATAQKNSVTSKSVKNNTLKGGDILNESLTGADIKDESLSGDDVQNGSIKPSDLAGGGAVNGASIVDNSVTGADIDESTLNVSRVVARAQGSTTQVDAGGTVTGIPLTGATYNRLADQTDFLLGSFTVNFPADCTVLAGGGVGIQINDGAEPVASGFVLAPMGTSGPLPGFISGNFTAVDAGAKSRTLTAAAIATCDAGATDPTLSDLKINVQGIR